MNDFSMIKGPRIYTVLAAALLLMSCSMRIGRGTTMDFSFNCAEPSDYRQEKTLYINHDEDMVSLDGTLKLTAGEVAVQVTDTWDGRILWRDVYTGDATIPLAIELCDLKAGAELELLVTASQCKKLDLTLTSDNKLVQDREAPERRPAARPDR